MNKNIKTEIAIGIILVIAIIVGGAIWLETKDTKDNSSKIELPVVPINDKKDTSVCTKDADCVKAYDGRGACWPCEADINNTDLKCVSPNEAERIFNQRVADKVQGFCEPCLNYNSNFECGCQNGACAKIEKKASAGPSKECAYNEAYKSKDNCKCLGNWVNLSESYYCESAKTEDFEIYSYEPKYGELKGFSLKYQPSQWALDKLESGNALGLLVSKTNNNCSVVLNAGGHGMPPGLETKDEEINLGKNIAIKRTWFNEKGGVVLVAITFEENSTPYIFEFKPQLADNQKFCTDGILEVLATFKYLP